MNRGVLESSPVQQLVAAGNPNWWSVSGGMRPPPPLMGHHHHHQPPALQPQVMAPSFLQPQLPPSLPNLLPQFLASPTSSSSSSSPSLPNSHHNNNIPSWLDHHDLPPESWSLSQLLLGGLMVGDQDHGFQGKKLENWEEQVLSHHQHQTAASMMSRSVSSGVVVDHHVKQENHNNGYVMSPNSPLNTTTTTPTTSTLSSSCNNSMMDFSSNHNSDLIHPPPDRSSEYNSSDTGGSAKKPKVQPSPPSTQSTLKVRKEKLGGRIAALHQLVSPFGKTDTASVLSEAIGYIRFLQSQIEALSLPYFGTASASMRHQQHVQGDRNCIFPEDPGQLVNDNCMKRRSGASFSSDNQNPNPSEEPKKDLRSRGLCLVPVSCTLQVGSDNGADYWSPAFGSGFR